MREHRVGEREYEVGRAKCKKKKQRMRERDKGRQRVGRREAAAENKIADRGFQNSDLLSNHMAET